MEQSGLIQLDPTAALEQKLSSGPMRPNTGATVNATNSHPAFHGGSQIPTPAYDHSRVPSTSAAWDHAGLGPTGRAPSTPHVPNPYAANMQSFSSPSENVLYDLGASNAMPSTSTQHHLPTNNDGSGILYPGSGAFVQDNAFAIPDMLSPKSQEIMEGILQGVHIPPDRSGNGGSGSWSLPGQQMNIDPALGLEPDQAMLYMTDSLHQMHTDTSRTESPWSKGRKNGAQNASSQSRFSTESSPTNPTPQPEVVDSTLMGGWYESTDVPTVLRDKLLAQFDKINGGSYLFQSRFRVRLTLEPKKRPHPCWLYGVVGFSGLRIVLGVFC
jgi:hypothetical protein